MQKKNIKHISYIPMMRTTPSGSLRMMAFAVLLMIDLGLTFWSLANASKFCHIKKLIKHKINEPSSMDTYV